MKIFLSHNFKDKDIVTPIANQLALIYGQSNIFFDSWSIKPGDGIVDKMNEGLKECDRFIFFMSNNSLNSEMVKLEWQSALISRANKNLKFIPVKLDNCSVPTILSNILYIDFNSVGFEVGLSQIVLAIDNKQKIVNQSSYENFGVSIASNYNKTEYLIDAYAKHFTEPIAKLLIEIDVSPKNISFTCPGESVFSSNTFEELKLSDGSHKIIFIESDHPITSGFPLSIRLTSKNEFNILKIYKQVSKTHFKIIWSKI